MPTVGIGERSWDFFVAHARADSEVAIRVAALLEGGGATVFLDTNDLRPGDVWPQVLAEAQENSEVTVILVSSHTGTAYYQLEELAAAIQMSRSIKTDHRVAPVYLERVEQVPYGLRIVHGLWALDDAGLETVVEQLLRLLPDVSGHQLSATLWSPRVPSVGPFFTGRDEILGRLAAQGSGGVAVLTQSVAGLGGVGKTTLAAALCWEQAKTVDIVWWLQAETEATRIRDLADLAIELGAAASEEPLVVQADRARRALENSRRSWMLVFDNAESDRLVYRFAPRRGNGRVIVTTRRRGFGRLGPVIDVDIFDQKTAEGFLRARVAETNPSAANDPQAATVARRLGGLPLALEQAGAYVAYSPLRSFSAYLDVFDDCNRDPYADGVPIDYRATATTTWQISIDAAGRRAPLAPRIMAAFGYLAPAPVPLACFVSMADHPYLATTAAEVTTGIEELYAYSLVAIDHSMVSVHRVVRDAARRLGDPAASLFVVDAIHRIHPRPTSEPNTWKVCADLLPHVLVAAALTQPEAAGKVSFLLDRAGTALRYAGAASQAIPLLQQAVSISVDVYGLDHPCVLQNRHDLATAYLSAGRTTEAVALYEATLDDRQRILGGDHSDTLNTFNNLARAVRAAGRIFEAITMHEAILATRQRVLGEHHNSTLTSRNNLAFTYRAAGRIAEAIAIYEATLADRERILGIDHPDTLTSRNNLAYTYLLAGRTAEAITMHEATLADRERILGIDHPTTLISRGNLAVAYRTAGRTAEAIAMHEANLADRERILGAQHPTTLESHNHLAETYRTAGRTAEAIAMHEANLVERGRVLGAEHPDTIETRNLLVLMNQESKRSGIRPLE